METTKPTKTYKYNNLNSKEYKNLTKQEKKLVHMMKKAVCSLKPCPMNNVKIIKITKN